MVLETAESKTNSGMTRGNGVRHCVLHVRVPQDDMIHLGAGEKKSAPPGHVVQTGHLPSARLEPVLHRFHAIMALNTPGPGTREWWSILPPAAR